MAQLKYDWAVLRVREREIEGKRMNNIREYDFFNHLVKMKC